MKTKYLIILGVVMATFMASCYPKASQVIRSLPVESKAQIKAQYDQGQLAQGQQLFISNCAKCHKLKDPESKTPEQWNKTVKRMIPRAKLSDEQGKLVRAYLIANAK
ncbi:hypothetical protein DBR32_07890 [Taibaiella sp. KBW10]|uniref:c-type cytochrome n=1 Tax=Taibaiella sp. KBW10 TaxID=2153357 RepID=UPI000F5910E0|nr:c-type cytochrome [Taibaiella sp. KBW10]RQO30646.1 hypothetical protein DBR32_07890 [Taibaiella sp. KBW10]